MSLGRWILLVALLSGAIGALPQLARSGPDLPPISTAELVRRMLEEARERGAAATAAPQHSFSAVADGGPRAESLRRGAVERIAVQIEVLLAAPEYLSLRDLRVRQIHISDDAIGRMRDAAFAARESWFDILEQLIGDAQLHEAVMERMGERRFLAAKQAIERRFSVLPEMPRGAAQPPAVGSNPTGASTHPRE